MASDIFFEAFRDSCAGCYRQCLCGKEHFDASVDGNWDWEEGEFEGLEKSAQECPEKCQAHYDSVRCAVISGREIVIGCTCDTASQYEAFIKEHSYQILVYPEAYLLREEWLWAKHRIDGLLFN